MIVFVTSTFSPPFMLDRLVTEVLQLCILQKKVLDVILLDFFATHISLRKSCYSSDLHDKILTPWGLNVTHVLFRNRRGDPMRLVKMRLYVCEFYFFDLLVVSCHGL